LGWKSRNIDNSAVFEIVNDPDSDQYEDASDEITEISNIQPQATAVRQNIPYSS
jgi:hypothetical protein